MNQPTNFIELLELVRTWLADTWESTHADADVFVAPCAWVLLEDGFSIVVMPCDGELEQRLFLRSFVLEHRARAVVHVNEAWVTKATTPEEIALSLELRRQDRLSEAPAHMLCEVVRMWIETPMVQVFSESAPITRDPAGRRTLGPWSSDTLRYPRPTFRRYFPEASAVGAES